MFSVTFEKRMRDRERAWERKKREKARIGERVKQKYLVSCLKVTFWTYWAAKIWFSVENWIFEVKYHVQIKQF